MLGNLIQSLIRTYVPLAVGVLLTWLAASLHIVIDSSTSDGLVALTAAVLSGAYYLLARLLESRFPALTILLGSTTQPALYASSGTTASGWTPESIAAALSYEAHPDGIKAVTPLGQTYVGEHGGQS